MSVFLFATALDGNNGIFPIVFVVVESKCEATCAWFIVNMQIAFEGALRKVIPICDQDKGLHVAVSEIIPEVEHRVCMRHFWKTFKKNYPGLQFEQVVKDASRFFHSLNI